MSVVGLLGASGLTGRLIARELAARGRSFVACGRDPDRVRAAVRPFGDVVSDVRAVDVHAPDTIRAALADLPVAISAIGPFTSLGEVVVDAAIATGTALVDVSGEQGYVRWVHEQRGDLATRAGVVLVPGAGVTGAVGTLLGALAIGAAGSAAHVHVAYTTPGGWRRPAWSAGTRRTVAGLLARPGWAYRDDVLVEEPLGEGRRLAWFPRPIGPMHAAAVPGIEAVALPSHLGDLKEVHTYLAMSTWKAEALQAIGNASRREAIRRRLVGWLERDLDPPSDERRAATRWACVAEARGETGLARAWAYGRDPYATAASIAVAVGGRLGPVPAGVWAPSAIGDPAGLLDDLSARGSLRWSVLRPDA